MVAFSPRHSEIDRWIMFYWGLMEMLVRPVKDSLFFTFEVLRQREANSVCEGEGRPMLVWLRHPLNMSG